ncbi:phenylacetate--CoA ligase family protein [Halobiforma nitratireducens]|uniref:phenylacetate--CoA ligase family protein n=1 Tax=Halobiforma nitratireducens TaxID=130048 RepID=UPI00126850DE|nr:phenylacetate--CoA ligase family protein [Halobiforma nitratireducens]
MLEHAAETVPYYAEVLREAGVVEGRDIHLDRFSELPLLTKAVLREQGDRLESSDPGDGVYTNTSGGTTGEPVEFLQDSTYLAWAKGNQHLYHRFAGRELGEPWVKLWGDASDISGEDESLKDQLTDRVLNRHVLNSYRMGESDMREHVAAINDIQPADIEAYAESIHELSKFVLEEDLEVHSPNGILSTAGTLTEPMRDVIEDAFETTVLDKYGSREVGTVACECPEQEGLHVFSHTHYVEIVDDEGQPVAPGEEGKLAITPLTNYTMPLIRYEIGDMAVTAASDCSCELPFPVIESVTGRVTDHFVTTDGELVYPGYLRKLLYHEPWVEKYQIQQTAANRVVYRIVVSGSEPPQETTDTIVAKTRSLLGDDTIVDFEYVDQIGASMSGKFRYTLSDVVE